MSRQERISDRVPRFYKSWEKSSIVSMLIQAISKELDTAEQGITDLMKAHWVDSAQGLDLERLGNVVGSKRFENEGDEHLRMHLKNAVDEFKGGGTISAIIKEIHEYTKIDEIKIEENPLVNSFAEFVVVANDTWKLGSISIQDEQPELSLTVVGEGEISNPKITNLESGQSISFEGNLKTGQQLVIKQNAALLDGNKVTEKVTFDKRLVLPRKGSTWKYSEALLEAIGVFDQGKFDESTFSIGVPTVRVRFDWTRRQPATFMIQVEAEKLSESGINESGLERMINYLKAAGINVIIDMME